MLTRRTFLKAGATGVGAVYLATRARFLERAYAKTPQPTLPLPGRAIPQFADPLPGLVLVDGTDGSGGPGALTVRMQEFLADVMPSTFVPAPGVNYTGTYVWGYQTDGASNQAPTVARPGGTFKNTYINPVVLAERHVPTQITWVNELPTGAASQTYWEDWTDLTLHWALGTHSTNHYNGPVPSVPHLHGGEVPPQLDGGPDAWFLPNGTKGHAYYSKSGAPTDGAIYRYPNSQEAANIWFHDHALGITRINVYSGLAGGYLLSDPGLYLPTGLGAYDVGGRTIIPLVIQDRMFDVDGQLYFPNVGDNPALHPFWAPEFLGDTIVVNGKVWPFKNLDNNRYRFLFLNGSNARAYEMFLVDTVTDVKGPPMWVIGTDGGYLDNPVKIDPNAAANDKLVMMPGERYDVIIDFDDSTWKQNISAAYGALGLPDPVATEGTVSLYLRNTGRTPYPFGVTPDGKTLGRVMQFNVAFTAGADGYNPASGTPVRKTANPDQRIVRLSGPTVTRQLTLNEVMGPLGPFEALVNNTKWDGKSVATDKFTGGVRPDFTEETNSDGSKTYYSELPQEGETELWEVINMTADAHPLHLHLVQFQLLSRQKYNVSNYTKSYDALFPGSSAIDPATGQAHPPGVFIGGYGPPAHYTNGTTFQANPVKVTNFLGGNPDINLKNKKGKPVYLQGPAMPPLPQENGWKDTVIMFPGEVTRILVRWAPTDVANGNTTDNYFPFDPNGGHGFVWHCHIIDHEDNEMMRPDTVTPKGGVTRTYEQGTDY